MRLGTAGSQQPDLEGIPLEAVSHRVVNMWMDDNKLMAEITILDTDRGKLLFTAMQAGVSLRFAPVGSGTIEDSTITDYNILYTTVYIGEEPNNCG